MLFLHKYIFAVNNDAVKLSSEYLYIFVLGKGWFREHLQTEFSTYKFRPPPLNNTAANSSSMSLTLPP